MDVQVDLKTDTNQILCKFDISIACIHQSYHIPLERGIPRVPGTYEVNIPVDLGPDY